MLLLFAPLSLASTCANIEPASNFGAGYIFLDSGVASAADCCALCGKHEACVAWDYNVQPPHECWLKDNTRGRTYNPLRASGLKTAPPPPPTAGGAWDRIGPWNIFNDKDLRGEAGTLACAASPKAHPEVIYAGGQNNGVSSGILKTVDGGVHWARKSRGLWDSRVLGVWVHPDEAAGTHVFAGTHSGIYESLDGAESWVLRNETSTWGSVMSFRSSTIRGEPYILANAASGYLLTMPRGGGAWSRIKAPGGIAPNTHLSVVEVSARSPGGLREEQTTEVLTCIGGWGGGQLYYASPTSPTNATWTGPLMLPNESYKTWGFFPGTSQVWGKCANPTSCDADVKPLGAFADLPSCQAAVNASYKLNASSVASYTYMHNDSALGAYAAMCYVISSFDFEPHSQDKVDTGRAPGLFPGGPIDCANAAVDPHDRDHFLYSSDHFLYSKGGAYTLWESKDGGKSVRQVLNFTSAAYFVLIDTRGWFYTATQAGAFRSTDGGASFQPLHVIMHSRDGRLIDRVPHDYQRIVPDFRGDQIALPSDQGLHIVNGSNVNLTSAVGDLHNNMALSAIISPSKTQPGSRNVVVNLWDWNVGASWDDGATWAGWAPAEHSPGWCGEGGGGEGMGASGNTVLFHRTHWASSQDGGHNWNRGDLPGVAGAFAYLRKRGSRSEPEGTCFALMTAPANRRREEGGGGGGDQGRNYKPEDTGDDDDDDDDDEMDPNRIGYTYDPGLMRIPDGNQVFLMYSTDFGASFNWTAMPPSLQAGGLGVDPTTNRLYALTADCLAHSTDHGRSWSGCMNATGLSGPFAQLLVKDAKVMFMLRQGKAPLRTKDGGASWHELESAAPLFKYGATMDGRLSWSGGTLVLHGVDLSAVGRGQYGTSVWRSSDDGDEWVDETGDLVTISPGPGVWYERDFYFVTRGEGVTVKRNFEAAERAA